MKSMGISDFKARCIAVLREAHRTGEPLIVTRRGEPLVRIEPIAARGGRRLGSLQNFGRIVGDIVGDDFSDEWELEHEDDG